MTRRRELARHLRKLREIRDIMNSMKSLAFMETRRLARAHAAQRRVVDDIEAVAADFFGSHPGLVPAPGAGPALYVVIGSERGFCGDFNEALLTRLNALPGACDAASARVVAVGHKLQALLEDDPRVVARLDGASVGDEVEEVVHDLAGVLASIQAAHAPATLTVLGHRADGEIAAERLLPPFQHYRAAAPARYPPPLLYLSPQAFLSEFIDHYLFAGLHEILYASLLAENHRRLQHLEGAIRHVDEDCLDLSWQVNALRQEEIIEEIEIILLSAGGLAHPRRR